MSQETFSLGERHVWHPFTPKPHLGPRALITRAAGAYVYDDKGQKYFDATSSWWCNLHGHCHPRLVEALARQAGELDHVMFAPHSHPLALRLASELVHELGSPFARIFYSDNGSTAVETALKIAAQFWYLKGQPEKHLFLSMERGYHGDTMGAVSISHLSQFHGPFEKMTFPSLQATLPYCYRCPLNLKYPQCQIACVESTLRTIEEKADQIAAFIVEPLLLGAGGMISYPAEYLEKVMAACQRHGILVIFDEVFTGFGRTGTMFAFQQLKHRPDMICLSKGLTSGMMPMSVTAVTENIFSEFDGGPERTFYHGHTYTANALGCAIALESLAIFKDDQVLARNQKLSDIMAEQVARFEALSSVGTVRHLGMVWALELVKNKVSKATYDPANGPGWEIAGRLWDRGFWIRPLNQMLYFVPPYCTSESELQDLFSVLYSAIETCKQLQI